MSNLINAIPGMASYMDADIDVEVKVGEPEEIAAEAEETAAEAVEVETTDTEIQEDADAAEEMFARFDEVDRMEAYVAKYGVDRAFLALNNYEGSLAAALVTLPSCESFDVTGNVSSPESIACMEGFKEAAKAVWEFIKRMAAKIKEFVLRIVEMIRQRFTSLDKNIGRMREAMKSRTDAPELLKDVKTTVYTKQQLEAIGAKNIKAVLEEAKKAADDLAKCASAISSGKQSEAEGFVSASDTIVNSIVASAEKMKKGRGAAKKVALSKISWAEAGDMLNTAAEMKTIVDLSVATANVLKSVSEQFIKVADGMKNRGDEGGKDLSSIARKASSLLNRVSSAFSGVLAHANWMAGQYMHTAGQRITRGSKKSSAD